MLHLKTQCDLCKLFTKDPCLKRGKTAFVDGYFPANKNHPPLVRAECRKALMTKARYTQLGLESAMIQVSRRDFPGWVAMTLADFQDKGGNFLRPACAGIGLEKCTIMEIPEGLVEKAFGLATEENYGQNERFNDDCRWISDWWNKCRSNTVTNAPKSDLFERLQLIDLALRTPKF